MDIARVRAVIAQMTLKEKVNFLGCGLSMKTAALERLKILGMNLNEELLFYKPTLSALGCTFDRGLVEMYGEMCGYESRKNRNAADGVINLGVIRDPMKPGAEKMFSEDPYVTAELAKAYTEGAGSVIGLNILSGEGAFCDRYMDPRAMREIYFKPYETVAASLAGAVIPSGCFNGEPLSNSKQFMQITQSKLKADALLINEPGSVLNKSDAVNSGASFEIAQSENGARIVMREVENGRLSEKRVDQCLERLLMFISERYENLKKPEEKKPRLDFDERAASESIVLLKNDGTLPLKPGAKVSFSGDLAKEEAAIFGGFKQYTKSTKESDTAVIFARAENGKLPLSAEKLLVSASDQGKKTILVILSPRPVETNVILTANAVLYVPYMYFSTFQVILKVLTGEINPSGKLNVSWAFHQKDYPAHRNEKAAARGMFCYESVYNGYRFFNSFNEGVQFPFGHGLSYTQFEYSKLSVEADQDVIEIEFIVKNAGEFSGENVVLVFCDLEESPVYGLKSRLAAFARVSLEKGENTAVRMKIPYNRLNVFSEEQSEFVTPGGKYVVKIAESATNVRISGSVKIPHPSRVPVGLDRRKIPGYYAENHFSPLGAEIELLLKTSLMQTRNYNADYINEPPQKKRAALEKTAQKRIKRAKGSGGISDFTGVSEFGFNKINEADL